MDVRITTESFYRVSQELSERLKNDGIILSHKKAMTIASGILTRLENDEMAEIGKDYEKQMTADSNLIDTETLLETKEMELCR